MSIEKTQILNELMSFNMDMLMQSRDQIEHYFDLCGEIARSKKHIFLITSNSDNKKLFQKREEKIKSFLNDKTITVNQINTVFEYGNDSGLSIELYEQMPNFINNFFIILQTPNKNNINYRHNGYVFEIQKTYDDTLKEKKFTMFLAQLLYYMIEPKNRPLPPHPFLNISDDQFIDD